MSRQQEILITSEGLRTYFICQRAWYYTEGRGQSEAPEYTAAQKIIAGRRLLSERLTMVGGGSVVAGILIFAASFIFA